MAGGLFWSRGGSLAVCASKQAALPHDTANHRTSETPIFVFQLIDLQCVLPEKTPPELERVQEEDQQKHALIEFWDLQKDVRCPAQRVERSRF
jgi:hypothetical protein